MVKILVVKSTKTNVPLAEIRTDGKTLDFIVDNTDGSLPSQVQNSLSKLTELVEGSSHLSIESPDQPTVGLLRYMLDTGDVIEVTTDGKTALLNGKILKEEEKKALFNAIKRSEIKVKSKTNIETPIPIFALKPKSQSEEIKKPETKTISVGMVKKILEKNAIKEQQQKFASKHFDSELERIADTDDEDKEWTKKLLYMLKYGE